MSSNPNHSGGSSNGTRTYFSPSRRVWWFAGILSYLMPGLGQVYTGQASRGLLFHVLYSIWGSTFFIISLNGMRGHYKQYAVPLIFFFLIISLGAFLAIIIDAIRQASKRRHHFEPKPYNKIWIYGLAVLIYQGSDIMVRRTVGDILVKPYKIPTASMSPTLEPGDMVLCDKLVFVKMNPQRGDVVVFEHPDRGVDYIKRLIGLPGDTVEIRNKQVYINSIPLKEPYKVHVDSQTLPAGSNRRDFFGPEVLPDHHYFVMGDNRDNSLDSRFWGPVHRSLIHGKPSLIYWSWDVSIPAWKFIRKWGSIRKERVGSYVK